jgi:hypothetical protein
LGLHTNWLHDLLTNGQKPKKRVRAQDCSEVSTEAPIVRHLGVEIDIVLLASFLAELNSGILATVQVDVETKERTYQEA